MGLSGGGYFMSEEQTQITTGELPSLADLRRRVIINSTDLAAVRWGKQYALNIFDRRVIVWFSCGAASAAMLKLLAPVKPVAVYCDTRANESQDNTRFLEDVENWTGVPITIIGSEEYKTCEEVWEDRQYMSGISGAPCTVELKKRPRWQFQTPMDVHCFGLSLDETMPDCKRPQNDRIRRMENDNPELNLSWPLRDAGILKRHCLQMVSESGIELPEMYQQGFDNNNCKGCVKATSPHYWNLTRKYYPEVFAARAKQSRAIGCRLARYKGERIFLDELPANANEVVKEDLSCGPQCMPQEGEPEITVIKS